MCGGVRGWAGVGGGVRGCAGVCVCNYLGGGRPHLVNAVKAPQPGVHRRIGHKGLRAHGSHHHVGLHRQHLGVPVNQRRQYLWGATQCQAVQHTAVLADNLRWSEKMGGGGCTQTPGLGLSLTLARTHARTHPHTHHLHPTPPHPARTHTHSYALTRTQRAREQAHTRTRTLTAPGAHPGSRSIARVRGGRSTYLCTSKAAHRALATQTAHYRRERNDELVGDGAPNGGKAPGLQCGRGGAWAGRCNKSAAA